MASPYVGEIRLFAGNFAPAGWMTCDGQTLAIASNNTLFNLIGTTYGGDGQNTFNLPNLVARVPVHLGTLSGGSAYTLGENGGQTQVTLTQAQLPSHTHTVIADANAGTSADPTNRYLANATTTLFYSPYGSTPHPPALRALNPAMLPSQGGSQPHDNMQPYLAITYIIAMYGTTPTP